MKLPKNLLWGFALGLLPGYFWAGWMGREIRRNVLDRDQSYHQACDQMFAILQDDLERAPQPKKSMNLEFVAGGAKYQLECAEHDGRSKCALTGSVAGVRGLEN